MHFDAHVHTAASPDSQLPARVAVDTLARQNLGVAFTEHCDFVTQTVGRDFSAADVPRIAGDFMVDFARFDRECRPLRSDSVLLGLEFTLSAAFLPLNTTTAAQDWDYVLGAVHTVDGLDLFHEAQYQEPASLARRYLTYAREMVELCGFFDALAHIDYICRYATGVAEIFRYENFPGEFDGLLRAVGERGLALEINTKRFGDAANRRALFPLYERFAQLGGRYVTIGSDAHTADWLGKYYKEALQLAREAGLAVVYFKERKRFPCEGMGW